MSYLQINNLKKSFKDDHVLKDVNLSIDKGEFFVVFGPSGSGKTVLLRLISGIMFQDKGNIEMDGKIINELNPEERDISMAFQNFALYPHMDAYENIASPLRAIKSDEKTLDQKVKEVSSLLKIDHVLTHMPKELSNGQKQRTSLARSLVSKPSVVLLDDPLRNVDAKIRFEMRLELPKILKEFNTTVIYITQDYREAMALGDRIGVLYNGKFNDIEKPREVYTNPQSLTSAKLFGDPTINNFTSNVQISNGSISINLGDEKLIGKNSNQNINGEYIIGIRPEDIKLSNKKNDNSIKVEFRTKTPLNLKIVYLIKFINGVEMLCSMSESESLSIDENKELFLDIDYSKIHLFDSNTQETIF